MFVQKTNVVFTVYDFSENDEGVFVLKAYFVFFKGIRYILSHNMIFVSGNYFVFPLATGFVIHLKKTVAY